MPCGNRTRLSSLEGWRLCRSANGTCFVAAEGDQRCASVPGARRNYQQLLPRIRHKTDRALFALVRPARGRGFEPLSPDSKSGSLPLADPRIDLSKECHAGIEPAHPAWKAGAFADRPMAHVSLQRKERESNSQGSVSARPLSRRLPSPIGLPFHRQHRQQESNLRRVSS